MFWNAGNHSSNNTVSVSGRLWVLNHTLLSAWNYHLLVPQNEDKSFWVSLRMKECFKLISTYKKGTDVRFITGLCKKCKIQKMTCRKCRVRQHISALRLLSRFW
jgi:hypothetical protein